MASALKELYTSNGDKYTRIYRDDVVVKVTQLGIGKVRTPI